MTGARLRLLVVLSGLALGGLVLLAWTQSWFEVTLTTGFELEVAGDRAAPALSTFAFATLALSAALTIAGRMLRYLLGALEAALGGLVAAFAAQALADPIGAAASTITETTAVSGRESIADLVLTTSSTPFPVLAIVAGALVLLLGLVVLLTERRWPRRSTRYDAARSRTPGPAGAWDALSEGSDPTR